MRTSNIKAIPSIILSLFAVGCVDSESTTSDILLSSDEGLVNVQQELLGTLSFWDEPDRQCTQVRQDKIIEAWEHGKKAVTTGAYQACTLKKVIEDYSFCKINHTGAEDPPEALDLGVNTYQHWLGVYVELVQGNNDLKVGCRPGGNPGMAGERGDLGYDGLEKFSFSNAHVDYSINKNQDDPHTINHLAGTFWHEAAHNHSYRHGASNTNFCGVSGPQDTSKTMPYILGDCMKQGTFANRIIAYAGNNQNDNTPRQVFGPGIYRASQQELDAVGDNAITQFRVGPGIKMVYCTDEVGARGENCDSYTNTDVFVTAVSLPGGFSGAISYLEVHPAVIGFEQKYLNSQSDQRTFDLTAEDLRGQEVTSHNPLWVYRDRNNTHPTFAPIGTNALNSLIAGDGLLIRSCDHSQGLEFGNFVCIESDGYIFFYGTIGEDKTSRLEIQKAVALYSQDNLYGSPATLTEGVYSTADLQNAGYTNQTSKSILVPPGLKARACDWNNMSTNGSGCTTFSDSVLQLDNTTLLNDISSLEVYPSCGDGVLDSGELCDEGISYFGICHRGCRSFCGNGVLDEGEVCDDGLTNGTTIFGCNSTCTQLGFVFP